VARKAATKDGGRPKPKGSATIYPKNAPKVINSACAKLGNFDRPYVKVKPTAPMRYRLPVIPEFTNICAQLTTINTYTRKYYLARRVILESLELQTKNYYMKSLDMR